MDEYQRKVITKFQNGCSLKRFFSSSFFTKTYQIVLYNRLYEYIDANTGIDKQVNTHKEQTKFSFIQCRISVAFIVKTLEVWLILLITHTREIRNIFIFAIKKSINCKPNEVMNTSMNIQFNRESPIGYINSWTNWGKQRRVGSHLLDSDIPT